MCFVGIGEFGRRLRARRTAAGRTIASVAAEAGLSVPYIANLENGRGNPTVSALSALARALGTELHVGLGDSAPATAELPDPLAQFARHPRFARELPDIVKRERYLVAMAGLAALSDRPLSEWDCHRLLDAVILMLRP
jgi:transcriptional regulator with XRE-family HTH domain